MTVIACFGDNGADVMCAGIGFFFHIDEVLDFGEQANECGRLHASTCVLDENGQVSRAGNGLEVAEVFIGATAAHIGWHGDDSIGTYAPGMGGVFGGCGDVGAGHADDDGDAFVGFFYNDFDESLPLSIREILKFTPKHGKDQATSTGGDAEVDLTLKALDIKVTGSATGVCNTGKIPRMRSLKETSCI